MADQLLAERVAVVTVHLRGTWLGVREVNAVQPGLIRTPMTAAMPPEVVLFASDLASYITGTVIEVGGGRYI